jgi:GTP-binding protein YchF
MSLTAGIVGLPNVGKSTLFNAITKQKVLAANYPFATIEPNVGIVNVPDKRLNFLNDLYKPKSLVNASFEFTDIAGLVKGASAGDGLGNKFLSHIREVDAIIEVVRCFENENITHVEGKIDPLRDIDIIKTELILADLETIDNKLKRTNKKAILSNNKEEILELEILNKIKISLEQNISLREQELNKDELTIIKSYNFLTLKPIIYACNISESDYVQNNFQDADIVFELAKKTASKAIVISARFEEELSNLNEEEKQEFFKEYNITETGLDKLIIESYSLLGLATYFTAGSDEVKAWTFKKGMKAPKCAGIIHTDFEKGFIKAEIMSYSDLENLKSELNVKNAGKMRLEGKEYLMQDGDICYFRFN